MRLFAECYICESSVLKNGCCVRHLPQGTHLVRHLGTYSMVILDDQWVPECFLMSQYALCIKSMGAAVKSGTWQLVISCFEVWLSTCWHLLPVLGKLCGRTIFDHYNFLPHQGMVAFVEVLKELVGLESEDAKRLRRKIKMNYPSTHWATC